MKKFFIPGLFFLFLSNLINAQYSFIKVLGRTDQDLFSSMDETIDGGIIFGGNYLNNYSITRCNFLADTIWTKYAPLISNVTLSNMCALEDGRFAFAGTRDGLSAEAAVVVSDSIGGFSDAAYFYGDDSWSFTGLGVYAMPDSGVLLSIYDDGFTCSNVVWFYSLDQNLNLIRDEGFSVCDAELAYSHGFNRETGIMNFIRFRYYEQDTAGNWYDDVPEIISVDTNWSRLLDTLYFNTNKFSGISEVSDSGSVIYGYKDTLGTREIYLLRIDKTGRVKWERSFGTNYDDYVNDVIETNDHGFVILTTKYYPGTYIGEDLVFYKTDSLGQVQFSNTYGSTGNEYANAMKKKKDGSLLILGKTNGFGQKVNMVIQLDSVGNFTSDYTINSSASHYCTGDTATLSVTPPAMNYLWSNGETTQTIKVTATGNYELTVTDSSGLQHPVAFHAVYFDSIPDATILNVSPVSFCEGFNAALTTRHGTGNNYEWFYNGNPVDTIYYRNFNALNSGTYFVIVSNICGSDTSNTVTVIKHQNPLQPQVTTFPSNHECFPSTIKLNTNSSGATIHWKWYGHDVTGDTLLLSQPGNYYINVQAVDSYGCVSPVQYNVRATIDSIPIVSSTPGTMTVCTPGSTIIPYTTSAAFGSFYLLRNDTMIVSSSYLPNYYATTTATYSIVMSNMCGSDTASVLASAYPKPVIQIFPPVVEICSGNPVMVTCTTPGLYQWITGWTSTPNDPTTQSFLITTNGYYQLRLTDSTTGCKSFKTIFVDTLPATVPVLNPMPDTVLCPGHSITLTPGDFISYLWSNGSDNSTFFISNTGIADTLSLTVTVIDTTNCASTDTINVILDICAFANEIIPDRLSVYPNPSAGEITFELKNDQKEISTLDLISLDGRLVKQFEFVRDRLVLNASEFSSDNYIYILKTGNESIRGVIGFVK